MRKSVAIGSLFGLTLALAACSTITPDVNSSPAAQGELSSQSASSTGQYLVGFRRGRGIDRSAITRAGGRINHEWNDLEAVAASLPAQALNGLRNNPNVEYVEEDLPRYALGRKSGVSDAGGNPGSGGTMTPAATTTLWNGSSTASPSEYTWGDNALRVSGLRAANYTGAGVAVCIGDTGIDGNHPEFARKLKGYKNFMRDGRDSAYALNDLSHHGTHVAGTVFAQYGAGTGAGSALSGMDANGVGGAASGVNLYMARVLGDDGSGSSSGIINGVNWCKSLLTNKIEAKVVISLSLGGGRFSRTEDRAYSSAYSAGVLTIAASGNDGAAVSYPAAYASVMAIGAMDDHANIASFSNFGSDVELAGPGVSVLSSVPLGAGQGATASAANVSAYSSVLAADFAAKGTVTNTGIVAAGGTNNEFCGVGVKNTALSGKIALISRGTCSFEEKVNNAVASGAVATIIYNNTAGDLGMTLNTQKSIPVVGITQASGQATLAALPTTGNVSIFASDYAYLDGTSMATPHVSAAAAVVWAAKPTLTNTQLRSLLKSTATDYGTAGFDNYFGNGLVNPLKAITGN